MTKNIRTIGSYEIVVADEYDNRILEQVHHGSLMDAQELANELIEAIPEAVSAYCAKVVFNTKHNVWTPS
jgi:hypothetical protein